MFIQTEDTPNPQTVRFVPGCPVLEKGVLEFSSDASLSPLAQALLNEEGVERVMLGQDFISVTKNPETSWDFLRPLLLTILRDFFLSGQPVLIETQKKSVVKDDLDPLSAEIQEIIDNRVRPAVAMDGGDIEFERFEDGVVYLRLKGACSGCPSSTATLKNGVENLLKHYVPEVQEVQAVNE